MDTTAKRVKTTLKEQKVSQSTLARWLGVKPQQIQAVGAGKILRPTNVVEMAADPSRLIAFYQSCQVLGTK